jgi:hypothetical protein
MLLFRRMLFVTVFAASLASTAIVAAASADRAARLVIDFGDGVQVHFTSLKVKEKSTAIDLLKAGEKHSRGIKTNVRGSGQTALVTAIDDLKNEGGGRTAKNWMYYINDKRSEVGAGAYELQPGDVIMWKFETYSGEQ